MSDENKKSEAIFKEKLEEKVSEFLTEEQVNRIKEATNEYFGVNNSVNGKDFFEQVILEAPKDYPTISMRFFQAVTELKNRLGRIFDASVALQKLEIEKELLEIEIEEMSKDCKSRKDELNIKLKEQDLMQKKIRITFDRDSLHNLEKEIQNFKDLCDKYKSTGLVKPFEIARLEEMDKKKSARYLNYVLHGIPLSPSELSFYYSETGALKPPADVVEKLEMLGRPDLALIEQSKIDAVEKSQLLLENKQQEQLLLKENENKDIKTSGYGKIKDNEWEDAIKIIEIKKEKE